MKYNSKKTPTESAGSSKNEPNQKKTNQKCTRYNKRTS